jgi:hypothetical protein
MKPPSTAAPAISVKRVRFIFYLSVSSSSEFLRFQVNDRKSMLPVTFLLHFVPRMKQLGIGADMETTKAASELAQKTREQKARSGCLFSQSISSRMHSDLGCVSTASPGSAAAGFCFCAQSFQYHH